MTKTERTIKLRLLNS